jgi:hypothetical protein
MRAPRELYPPERENSKISFTCGPDEEGALCAVAAGVCKNRAARENRSRKLQDRVFIDFLIGRRF